MRVLMLGNGFDLSYNLPTTYANFLHTIDFICKYYDPTMETIGSVFGDDRLTSYDDDIRKSYEKYRDSYNQIPLDHVKMNELREKASQNKWFAYFLKNFDKDVGWIDFEKEISKVINELSGFFALENKEPLTGRKAPLTYNGFHSFLWGIMHTFGFEGSTEGYLEDTQDTAIKVFDKPARIRMRYEKKQMRDTLYIEEPPGSKRFFINKDKIAEELFCSLYEFAEILSMYLFHFVEIAVGFLKSNGIIDISRSFREADRIVSFNYTNTYETLCPGKEICHIHGFLADKIVLGVNADEYDELTNIDTTFIPFKKYYQRVVFQTDTKYIELIYKLKLLKKECEQIIVCVMGHSLDITDRDIITELFGYADIIQIYYHNDSAFKQYVKNLVAIFGKDGFEKMRYKNNLTFIPLSEVGK